MSQAYRKSYKTQTTAQNHFQIQESLASWDQNEKKWMGTRDLCIVLYFILFNHFLGQKTVEVYVNQLWQSFIPKYSHCLIFGNKIPETKLQHRDSHEYTKLFIFMCLKFNCVASL